MRKELALAALAGYLALVGGSLLAGFTTTGEYRDHSSEAWKDIHQQTLELAKSSHFQLARATPAPAKVVQPKPPAETYKPSGTVVPADQMITVFLDYLGADENGTASFNFRYKWGDWQHKEQRLTVNQKQGGTATLDLEILNLRIKPEFAAGGKCRYQITLTDMAGRRMGQFEIVDATKPVSLTDSGTVGYSPEVVFFEKEKQLTAYRFRQQGKRADALGLLFVGRGWTSAETTDQSPEGPYKFPTVDFAVLPKEWMESNDINLLARGLK